MSVHEVKYLGITINVPFEQAYHFTCQPAHFPQWAAGLSASLRETEQGWEADTPAGRAFIRFSAPNAFGVLDHYVQIGNQPEIYVPLRMMANGTGTEVIFTLYRQPGMSQAMFEQDADLVMADLQALKALLEARHNIN